MRGNFQKMRMAGWVIFLAAFFHLSAASAAIVNLSAYVYIALLDQGGTTPLADGSLVQIIGSLDGTIDPMETYGSNVTGNVTGDDVILTTITINSADLGSNGTFYVSNVYYDSDDINYMYIRFYDSPGPLTGMIYWGESPITNVEFDAFGSILVDFIGGYSTTNHDNFVAIPEPNTLNFIIMWAGMIAAVRSTRRREARQQYEAKFKRLVQPQATFTMNTYDKF